MDLSVKDKLDLIVAQISDLRTELHDLNLRQQMIEKGWECVGRCFECAKDNNGGPVGRVWEKDGERVCHKKDCHTPNPEVMEEL